MRLLTRIVCIIALICLFGFVGFSISQKQNIINVRQVAQDENITINNPLVAIVPHHDLVKDKRAQLLKKLGKASQPKTIILLSPNHFNAGSAPVLTSDHIWTLSGGRQIEPDVEIIDKLKIINQVEVTDSFVAGEHGIFNILGDIKDNFPNSKIVPLVWRQNAKESDIKEVFEKLYAICPADCGVIASVDMSHYQTASIASLHDELTLRSLSELDEAGVLKSEVDSPQSLLFAILWAKTNGLNNFNLFDHTNSGIIANNPQAETTTHIFGYYENGEKADYPDSLTFTIGGDGMFGRYVGSKFQENNFKDLFSDLSDRTFWGTDISLINLEGPISDQEITQNITPDNLVFNFSKQAVEALKFLKLTGVSLANNHTINKGASGLTTTRKLLEENNIAWFGDPNKVESQSILRKEIDNIQVSVIGVNALNDDTGLVDLIKQEKTDGRFVIIFPHWGNEYQTAHSSAQEKLAKKWLDAGADLIIGSHPHVVQDAQVINNKLVIYSLGNFVFDQYFSAETQTGLIVGGKISDKKLEITLLPIQSINLKPRIAKDQVRNNVIDRICKNIQSYCKDDKIQLDL